MKKLLCIILFVSCVGCASFPGIPSKEDTSSMNSNEFISYVEKTVSGAEWIKGVVDLGMTMGCASGKIKQKTCNKYGEFSNYAMIAISNTKRSVETYKSTGTIISQDQVKIALEELFKVIFKLDNAYKTPVEKIEDFN